MKRLNKIICSLAIVAIAAIMLVGCSISGNTYTFESIETQGVTSATEDLSSYEARFKRDIAFSDNGTYTVGGNAAGYYKKSGGNIYVGEYGDIDTSGTPQYVLSGDKLIYKKTFDDGVSVTVTFKKV